LSTRLVSNCWQKLRIDFFDVPRLMFRRFCASQAYVVLSRFASLRADFCCSTGMNGINDQDVMDYSIAIRKNLMKNFTF
jgi:hypothetical protein